VCLNQKEEKTKWS